MSYWLVQYLQGAQIKAHTQAGGEAYSRWRAALIGVIGAIITLVAFFAVIYTFGSNDMPNSTSKTYGAIKNEIVYDKNIAETEIDRLADALTQVVFFDNAEAKTIYLKKNGSTYQISISCNNSISDNAEALKYFTQLQNDLQKLYPKNKIVIFLVVDRLDNVIKKIE